MSDKKTILIIEDDPALADISTNMLAVFGFASSIAQSGNEAVEKLKNDKYDLILLDLTLPDITGVEVYQKALSGNSYYLNKVIFTSGYHATDEIRDFMDSDQQTFLQKPFALDSIKIALSKVNY